MALVYIENGPAKGERVTLSGYKEYVGGRDSDAFIAIEDRLVSRRHFRIGATATLFFLEDLESANGTFLNGIRIARKKRLSAGDRIQIGETRLTFLADNVEDSLIGKTISGFEVLECVGRGGMGTVYKARQLSLDRVVALKVLSERLMSDSRFAELFHREARAAGQINHPSIVQVYDVDTVQVDDKDVTFFAMEFMSGGSVEELINREKKLGVSRALQITLDVSRGIQFAEKSGLVHRDIKPGNLMIGDTGEVKIVDLGIARRAESGSKASQEDGVSGSPHYMSPEQARGRDLDSGADMYSLGISLFHMLAGRPPFLATSTNKLLNKHIKVPPPPISEFRPDLPDSVVALIDRLIKKDRSERFTDGNELVGQVDAVLHSLAGDGASGGERSPRSKRLAIFSVSLLLLIVVGGAFGALFSKYRSDHQDHESNQQETLKRVGLEIENLLVEARIQIEDAELSAAETTLNAIDDLVDRHDGVLTADSDLDQELTELRELVTTQQTRAVKGAYHRRAQTALSDILEKLPADFSTVGSLEDFAKWTNQLKEFVEEYSNTPAGTTAREHIETLATLERQNRERRRVAQTELQRVTNRSETLLQFDPPRYRDAAEQFKKFIERHEGTPATNRGRMLLTDLRQNMESAAREATATAQSLSDDGKERAATRMLRRLRAEVDGSAAEMIDKALAGTPE